MGRKTKDAFKFLALEDMLKKSWEIHVLVKNLLTQWKTEEENQRINWWNTSSNLGLSAKADSKVM